MQYQVQDIGGQAWLVRRQTALDVLTNFNVQRELVCYGVRRFELVRSADAGWRLRVWTADRDEPSYDRIVTGQGGGAQ